MARIDRGSDVLARVEDAALVARKIVAAPALPCQLAGHEVFVLVSAGIDPDDGLHPGVLLKSADTATYRTKESGRNGYQFYSSQMNQRSTGANTCRA